MDRKPALTNVEFLALAIFISPGRSASFYCRALDKYRWPGNRPDLRHGYQYFALTGSNSYYDYRTGREKQQYRYPGRLWVNTVCDHTRTEWERKGNRRNGPTGSWSLTPAGIDKARIALRKLEFDLDTLKQMP